MLRSAVTIQHRSHQCNYQLSSIMKRNSQLRNLLNNQWLLLLLREQAARPVGEVVDLVRRSARHHRQPGEWWKANSSEQANIALSEPQTYQQAVSSPEREKWLEAINAEYESLNDNGTWELVERPKGRKLVSCKWVFKVKHNVDGTVDRYKARLVARAFTQTEGVDYHETYAPVVKMTSIRVLLSIVAIHDLELHQMDVKTAFLNGHLEEEIYMQQPEGFIARGNEHLVCKLKRTLYGFVTVSLLYAS